MKRIGRGRGGGGGESLNAARIKKFLPSTAFPPPSPPFFSFFPPSLFSLFLGPFFCKREQRGLREGMLLLTILLQGACSFTGFPSSCGKLNVLLVYVHSI